MDRLNCSSPTATEPFFQVIRPTVNHSITVNVTINPVDDAPTAITLSNNSVDENQPIGTEVGTFSTTDIDTTSFTYSFVEGENNNASFSIDGNALKTVKEFVLK